MRHRQQAESAGESSEDEQIIPPIENYVDVADDNDEDDFNMSQDLTQVVPGRKVVIKQEPESPKKKKKKRDENEYEESLQPQKKQVNGYKIREVDVSEIPAHVIANMARIIPSDSDIVEGLTADDVEASAENSKGGVWIIQCPNEVSLSSLISGKKLSLDGITALSQGNDEDDEDVQLTQYAPTDSLGVNVKQRQFEAVSVKNEDCNEGMMLLLPSNENYKIVTAPLNGRIIIRESVEELSVPKIDLNKPKPRELPSGIKERHPVYGADFSNILLEMETSASSGSSKKKKKKNRTSESILVDTEPAWKPMNGFHDKVPYVDIKQEILSPDEDSFTKKKKRKKNKHADDETIYSTELMNGNVTAVNGNGELSYCIGEEEDIGKKKKKSKKRKRDEMEEDLEPLDLDKTEVLLNTSKKSKKSKHRE